MKSIGIDLGSSQIKVVEVQTTSKGLSLTNYFIHDFSQKPGADPNLETIEFLRDLSQKIDFSDAKINVALRQDRVVIRNKLFPFSDRVKISKTLPLELEDDLPFNLDHAIYDGRIIRTLGPQAEVLACATPKTHLEKLLDLMKDCGLSPDVVSTEGLAFSNLFENWELPPPALASLPVELEETSRPERQIQIILNIGMTRTLVCAFEDHHLVGVRSILWGGKQIAEAIARKYELPLAEAMKEMEHKAFILTTKQESHFEAKIFSDTIAKSVRELLRDLQLSILEFKSEFNAVVTRVDITGGVSHIQGLGPYMTQFLEVPVNKISCLERFSHILFERTDVTDSRLGVAVGLAIEGLKKPRNPALNFLKNEYAKQNTQLDQFIKKWKLSLQVSATLLLLLYVWTITRDTFTQNLSEASNEALKSQAKNVAHLSAKQQNESGVKKYIQEKKKMIAEYKTLSQVAQMNSALDILKKINDSIPAKNTIGLDVKRFFVEESQVLLEGYVNSPRELALLTQSLNNMAIGGKISNLNSNLPTVAGRSSFALRFPVDRGIVKTKKE